MKKYLFLLATMTLIGGCSQQLTHINTLSSTIAPHKTTDSFIQKSKKQPAHHNITHKTGNIANLKQRFAQLQLGNKDTIRITQFGDSHSAADFFTGRLRNVLQQRYGNAGIGWVAPLSVRGQHHEKITYQSEGWQLFDSRRNNEEDYPMGGYIARAKSDIGFIRLNHRKNDTGKWALKVLAKYNDTNEWQVTNYTATLPTEITSKGEGMKIGGVWLTRVPATGVIVETIAANGAKNTLWDKWESSWLQRDLATFSRSDMVILSYGTNEAFNNRLDINKFARDMKRRVQQIRQALPKAVILIIGAPESYKRHPTGLSIADCTSKRPALLTQIQQIQSEIAQEQKTLYWDWQQAMGGKCKVPQLINDGLMQKDGIHFTLTGYRYSADKFIEYLQSIGLIQ